jgi:hypothetical protein
MNEKLIRGKKIYLNIYQHVRYLFVKSSSRSVVGRAGIVTQIESKESITQSCKSDSQSCTSMYVIVLLLYEENGKIMISCLQQFVSI